MNSKDTINKPELIFTKYTLFSTALFRFFIRKEYPALNLSNEEIDEIKEAFSQYLIDNLTNEQLNRIIPSSEMDVIMNNDNLLKQRGFHPAFVMHFIQFVKFIVNQ